METCEENAKTKALNQIGPLTRRYLFQFILCDFVDQVLNVCPRHMEDCITEDFKDELRAKSTVGVAELAESMGEDFNINQCGVGITVLEAAVAAAAAKRK